MRALVMSSAPVFSAAAAQLAYRPVLHANNVLKRTQPHLLQLNLPAQETKEDVQTYAHSSK